MKLLDEVMADPKRRAALVRRFWPKVDRSGGPNACWPWIAKAKHPYGYGRMNSRGAQLKAHQIAFALANGGPLGDIHVRHSCDFPGCCNPAHLIAGTHKDNMADAKVRGRIKPPPRHIGDTHPNAKMTADQIRLVETDPRAAWVLAGKYGVCEKTIYRIRWKQARLSQVSP